MIQNQPYHGGLTAEQFLFHEIRIAAKFYLDEIPIESAVDVVRRDNLFQYPTERQVSRLARACYKRLDALGNHNLIKTLAYAPVEIAKQINLYAIIRQNRLVREFMTQVIGEKLRTKDFSLQRKDLNAFFARLQAQDDRVTAWSEATIGKIKGVLLRMLVETEYLDNIRDTALHPVFLYEELERGIRENMDFEALPAFNCFR